MLISIPFLVLTVLSYLSIPNLRNFHGLCFVCYMIALLKTYILFTLIKLIKAILESDFWCNITGNNLNLKMHSKGCMIRSNYYLSGCFDRLQIFSSIINMDSNSSKDKLWHTNFVSSVLSSVSKREYLSYCPTISRES